MQNIEKFLKDTIKKYTDIQVEDIDKNLFTLGVMPLEFLYVINEIEKKYEITIKDLLHNSDYSILSIHNLSIKINCLVS
ncbi:hypothetical protein E5329_22720 [Petralouisia muris]|uniref:Uncharacterized protein n=1 Tax=Petralouisia muris TaxID=3032872 RepID=A0AC61RQ80_9FIRM|nr:phosphopantetheine-binding protein [Petralouisia muris]TGY91102.1 hypothetical protein E5329_22720 [Petralouisia muris]